MPRPWRSPHEGSVLPAPSQDACAGIPALPGREPALGLLPLAWDAVLHFRESHQEQKQHAGRMSRDGGSTMTLSPPASAQPSHHTGEGGGPSDPAGLCILAVLRLTPFCNHQREAGQGWPSPCAGTGPRWGAGRKTSACPAPWALPRMLYTTGHGSRLSFERGGEELSRGALPSLDHPGARTLRPPDLDVPPKAGSETREQSPRMGPAGAGPRPTGPATQGHAAAVPRLPPPRPPPPPLGQGQRAQV